MKIHKRDSVDGYKSIGDHRELNEELVGASDRVAPLLGASILDVHLGRLLSALFIEDQKAVELLMSSSNQNAPLSTLSAKTRAAYCLGLISRDEFEDISTVREIRNIFAHHLFDCDFHQPEIVAALSSLKTAAMASCPREFTNRVRFTFLIATLETSLVWRLSLIERRVQAQPMQVGPRLSGQPGAE